MNHQKHRGKPGRGASGRVQQIRGHGRPGRLSPAVVPISDESALNIYNNAGLSFGIIQLVGLLVDLRTRNNQIYKGILRNISSAMEVTLDLAQRMTNDGNNQVLTRENVVSTIMFNWRDIVDIKASNCDVDTVRKDTFTDSSIVKCNGQMKEKKLQLWEADADIPDVEEWDIEDQPNQNGMSSWDMFTENKEKFGVESSFDENMLAYTTAIQKEGNPDYERQEQEAARIAHEIESSKSYSSRNNIDDGRTEEEIFSSVVREQSPAPRSTVTNKKKEHESVQSTESTSATASPPTPSEDPKPAAPVALLMKPAHPVKNTEEENIQELRQFSTNFVLKTEEEVSAKPPEAPNEEPDTTQPPAEASEPHEIVADAESVSQEEDFSILKTSSLNPNAVTFCPKEAKVHKENTPPPSGAQAYPSVSPVAYPQKVGPHFPILPVPVQPPMYRPKGPFTKPNVPRPYYGGPDAGDQHQSVLSAAQATGSPIFTGHVPGPFLSNVGSHPVTYVPPTGMIPQYGQGQMQPLQVVFPGPRFPGPSASPYAPEGVYGGISNPQASPSQGGAFVFQPTLVGQQGGGPPQPNMGPPPPFPPGQSNVYRSMPYGRGVAQRPPKYGGQYQN